MWQQSSSAAESQAAADGDGDAVHIRFVSEVMLRQLDLQNRQTEARQIPAALVVDRRGVHDTLARSFSCLLKDEKYGLEALALKQSRVGVILRHKWVML